MGLLYLYLYLYLSPNDEQQNFVFIIYNYEGQIKGGTTNGARSTHGGRRGSYKMLLGQSERKESFGSSVVHMLFSIRTDFNLLVTDFFFKF